MGALSLSDLHHREWDGEQRLDRAGWDVYDPQRVDYIARHLLALQRALSTGVDLRGYFHWSLLDNLEWVEGVNQRFGLVHVDFLTQRRSLKQSAHFYRRVIEANAVVDAK